MEGREPEVQEERGGGEKALSQTVLHAATKGRHQPKTVWLLSEKKKWRGGSGWLVGEMGFKGPPLMFISSGKGIQGKRREGKGRKMEMPGGALAMSQVRGGALLWQTSMGCQAPCCRLHLS